MKKIYVDEKWCLGCHLCEYYCAFANSNSDTMAKAFRDSAIHPRIKIEEREGISFAVSCRHCADPLCVKSCISGAISIVGGVIRIDSRRCVSCYTCVMVCPYGAVMPSEKGAMQKCELCVQNSDKTPACVAGCPNKAIVFEER